jgi:HEPN domain-containing protein
MQNDKTNQNPWIFFANNDLKAAENLIHDIELTGEVAFLCQQAIEKYLKAFLFENKIQIQKTHDLEKLYSETKKIKDFEIDENLLQIIRNLYIESRYPTDIALLGNDVLPSMEDAKSYLEFTKNIAKIVLAEVK